jgi:hypothetical protein
LAFPEHRIPIGLVTACDALREQASILLERSRQLRVDSARLKSANALLNERIVAIDVRISDLIFKLDRPLLTKTKTSPN